MNKQDQMNANEEPTDEIGGKGRSEIERNKLKMKRHMKKRMSTRSKRPKRPKRQRQRRRETTTHHQTKHDESHHEAESAPREGDPEKTP